MSIRNSYRQTRKASETICGPGHNWIPAPTRNGRYVTGHCNKIDNNSGRTITRQTKKTYGWDHGPVVLREITTIEELDQKMKSKGNWELYNILVQKLRYALYVAIRIPRRRDIA